MRTDLLWRAALPAAALVTLVVGTPSPVSGILALAGAGLAVERLVATRRHGVVDAGLLWTGGMLVGLVLTGMALGVAGIGLAPTSWTVTLAVLALVGLGLAAVLPAREPSAVPSGSAPSATGGQQPGSRRKALVLLPWLALAAVVVVVAVRMTTGPQEATEAAPVTMALGRVDGTEVQVVVSASEEVGPLEIRTSSRGGETSYPLIEVSPDEATTTTVSLPRAGRYEITLANPGQDEPLRTLILDR